MEQGEKETWGEVREVNSQVRLSKVRADEAGEMKQGKQTWREVKVKESDMREEVTWHEERVGDMRVAVH